MNTLSKAQTRYLKIISRKLDRYQINHPLDKTIMAGGNKWNIKQTREYVVDILLAREYDTTDKVTLNRLANLYKEL